MSAIQLIKRISVQFIFFATFSIGLTACGGGGGDTTTVVQPPKQIITLVSSKGDLTKLTGMWRSGCGIFLSGTKAQSAYNFYQFSSPTTTTTVGGTATQYQFSDLSCLTSSTTVVNRVTLTFVAGDQTVTTSVNSTQDFVGSSDKISEQFSTLQGVSFAPTTKYFAFSDGFTKFREASSPVFSSFDSFLVKQ